MRVTCASCWKTYDDTTHWSLCPHAKRVARSRVTMPPLAAAGTARPSLPVSVFAEDFSLIVRTPRRMRIARSAIRVLS